MKFLFWDINKNDNRINIKNVKHIRILKNWHTNDGFLIFYNFIENKSIKISYINSLEFSKELIIKYITKKLVTKLFKIFLNKINVKQIKYVE